MAPPTRNQAASASKGKAPKKTKGKRKRADSTSSSSDYEPSPSKSVGSKKRARKPTPGKPSDGSRRSRSGKKDEHARQRTRTSIESPTRSRARSRRIPPWQTLPYHILLQIFAEAVELPCASAPIHCPDVSWLSKAARLCKAFLEPALTVLYHSPALQSPARARHFMKHIRQDPGGMLFNYRNKIRRLEIAVTPNLRATYTGAGRFDLSELVSYTPALRELELFDPLDNLGSYTLQERCGWQYPDQLFPALERAGVRLRSWRWNANMGKGQYLPRLREVHCLQAFQGLVRLAFVNYRPTKRLGCDTGITDEEVTLADAISLLPNLRHLTFESCPIVDEKILPRLPRHITALRLVNCCYLETCSWDLRTYLKSHGAALRELVLHHNQYVDLAFLSSLASTCPALELLSMDGRDVRCACLHAHPVCVPGPVLLPTERPAWPSTLRTLELLHLREPEVENAEMFLNSLLRAGPSLPQLRRLVMKLGIDGEWRKRAAFRDMWIPKLEGTFLRKDIPRAMSPTLSVAANRSGKNMSAEAVEDAGGKSHGDSRAGTADDANSSGPARRRSQRLQGAPDKDYLANSSDGGSGDEATADPQDRPIATYIGSKSSTFAAGKQTSSSGADADGGVTTNPADDVGDHQEDFVQGMCDVVDIRIDNLRPADQLMTEEDFLDEEIEGDEDWHE